MTASTWDGRVDHHPLPNPPPACYRANELVAQYERLSKDRVANAAFDEPVSIRATQTNRRHAQ
jgi:hypothetical protein